MTLHDYFTLFWRIALATFFLLVTLAAAAFLFPQQVLTVDSGEVKADALVVLGGGDGRAERGTELYRQGAAPIVIVSGYGDCESNIEVMERDGVPASVITPEPAALTTLQNATYSVPLLRAMRVRRVIIVTSWYHSRRALACFEHVAPDLQFYSRPTYVGYEPKTQNRMGYSWHVNYEYVKLLGYWVTYGVWPL
jgi:uncharacterized SAM-binding protein YcdF (DUF218 family)